MATPEDNNPLAEIQKSLANLQKIPPSTLAEGGVAAATKATAGITPESSPSGVLDEINSSLSRIGTAARPQALGAEFSPTETPVIKAPAGAPAGPDPLEEIHASLAKLTGAPAAEKAPTSAAPGGAVPRPPEEDINLPWTDRLSKRFHEAWNAPGEGYVGRTWGTINAPIISETDLESWLGNPTEQFGTLFGGITKGVYSLLGGMTSPLSLGFILGTAGLGGLVEGGAAATLRVAGGMSAGEISTVVKGSEVLAKSIKAGMTAKEAMGAMEIAGINSSIVSKGLDVLSKAGLTSHDLIRGSLIRTAGAAALRGVGMNVTKAERVGQGMALLIDGGFTAQNVYGAAVAWPSALDALKEGDTELAARLITEAAGITGFGLLGAKTALKEAGGMMDDFQVNMGLKVKPSDENLLLQREFGLADRQMTEAGRTHELWAEDMRKLYKAVTSTEDGPALVRNWVDAGGDESVMQRNYDLILKSAGRQPVSPANLLTIVPEATEGPKRTTRRTQATVFPKAAETVPLYRSEMYPGGNVSEVFDTYHKAAEVLSDQNPYVRLSSDPVRSAKSTNNEGRTLLVQISSNLINQNVARAAEKMKEIADIDTAHADRPPNKLGEAVEAVAKPELTPDEMAVQYYDKLYSNTRPGYARLHDFWEIPDWIARASHFLPDADLYVVRSVEAAKKFLNDAKYDRVLFSALDTNRDIIKSILYSEENKSGYSGRVDMGGYIDPAFFKDQPNVNWHDSLETMASAMGAEFKPGVSYRHFQGSDTIPRMTLSEGCLHKCAFCVLANTALKLSPEEVVQQQVAEIAKLGAKLVYINDKTFGQAKNYQDLAKYYEQIKKENPAFHGFVVQTTGAQINKIPEEWLAKSGIKYVELGIESFNDPILKEMHKPATEQLINKGVEKLRRQGIALIPNIIIGYPGETAATYAHTMEFLRQNRDIISHANIYNLALYKDVELGKKMTTASDGDFNENILEKSWHTDPNVVKKFAGDLYGMLQQKLDQVPDVLQSLRPLSELTPVEIKQLSIGKRAEVFLNVLQQAPAVEELVAAAKAGSKGRDWYDRSIKAFDAMRELAPGYFKPEDVDIWAGVLASTSPQQSVVMNLREALTFWKEWKDNGMPNTREAIEALQKPKKGKAAPITRLTNQDAKLPNLLKAINRETLLPETKEKYYKVGNFARNLQDIFKDPSGTFDSWMGVFFGFDEAKVPRASFYHAMAVQTRLAARELGWSPKQAQAAIWSFTKTLSETSGWKGAPEMEKFRPHEVVDFLIPEDYARYAKDFADLMHEDPEVRAKLHQMGVNIGELDKRLQAIPRPTPVEGAIEESTAALLRRSAERIGEAQQRLEGFREYSEYFPGERFDFEREVTEPKKSRGKEAEDMLAKYWTSAPDKNLYSDFTRIDEVEGPADLILARRIKDLLAREPYVKWEHNGFFHEPDYYYSTSATPKPGYTQMTYEGLVNQVRTNNKQLALDYDAAYRDRWGDDDIEGEFRTGRKFPFTKKTFEEQRYPHEQNVRVTFEDGHSFYDTVKGLNKGHALARARDNWEGAKVEALPAGLLPDEIKGEARTQLEPGNYMLDPKGGLHKLAADETHRQWIERNFSDPKAGVDQKRADFDRALEAGYVRVRNESQGLLIEASKLNPAWVRDVRHIERLSPGDKPVYLDTFQKGSLKQHHFTDPQEFRDWLRLQGDVAPQGWQAAEARGMSRAAEGHPLARFAGTEAPEVLDRLAPFADDRLNRLGNQLARIDDPDSGQQVVGLFKNERGENALVLAGRGVQSLNRVFRGGLEGLNGGFLRPEATESLVNFLEKHPNPFMKDLAASLKTVKNEPLGLLMLHGPDPFATLLHEHIHGALSEAEAAAVRSAIEHLPGYDDALAEISGLVGVEGRLSYPTEEAIYSEFLPRLLAGQLRGKGISDEALANMAWGALNALSEQSQYSKILGNIHPDVREQFNVYIYPERARGEGRPVSAEPAGKPEGGSQAQPVFAEIAAEQRRRGVQEGILEGPFTKRIETALTGYAEEQGLEYKPHELAEVNVPQAKELAKLHDKAVHAPDDPKVRATYDAFKRETLAQWNALKAAGIVMEPWTQEGQPYKNSAEMVADVNRGHLFFFTGGDFPADHPMLEMVPGENLNYMEIFRAVHDVAGHSVRQFQFGARGEENAWREHSKLYSKAARPAMTAETRMQNSWVNFGKQVLTPEGEVPKKGEAGYVPPEARPYAAQKAYAAPDQAQLDELLNEAILDSTKKAPEKLPSNIARALQNVDIVEGFTVNPITGFVPKSEGYAIEAIPERRQSLKRDVTIKDIEDFAEKNKVLLQAHPELFVGGYKRELNISTVLKTPEALRELGTKLDQIDAWDFAKGELLPLGGSGKTVRFESFPLDERLAFIREHSINTEGPTLKISRDMGDAPRDTSEARLHELAAQQHIKAKYSPKEIDALLRSNDPRNLTDQHRALGKEVKDHFNGNFERASLGGALEEGLENYVTQMWDKDSDNPAANRLLADSRSGTFAVNTSMARHRTFQHAIEGQLLGRKLAITDPIALAARNGNIFDRVVAARKVLERLQDKGTRASDGRPMVALSGSGKLVQGPDGENEAVIVHADKVRSIRIADKVVDGLRRSGDLDRLVKEGRVIKYGEVAPSGSNSKGTEHYAWATHDYRSVDHPSFEGWQFASQDTNGNPVLVRGELKVHPEAHQYIKRQLETQSPLAKAFAPVFTAGSEAKATLLSFDTFHLVQESLRALMTGVSPFGVEKWDLRTNPTLGKLVEHGLNMKSYGPRDTFQEGMMAGYQHSKLLGMIPIAGKISHWFEGFLFNKYIPSLKARAAEHLYNRYKKAYPQYSDSKVATLAATDTNNRFGGLNLRREGRSLLTQDVFRLVALAPDWMESELRSISRAMGGDGKVVRQDLAKVTIAMWLAARVLNQLNTGNPHYEAPFHLAYKDDEGRDKLVGLRTLPTDMLHSITDPLKFMRYRASPLERTITTVYTGRDSQGRRLPARDLVWDLLANTVIPMPLQNVTQKMSGFAPTRSWGEMGIATAGAQILQAKTEAQAKAMELSADRIESGPVDPNKLKEHAVKMEIEDRLRAGSIQPQELWQMVDQDLISPKEAKTIMGNINKTKGMEVSIAKLFLRSSRLPMADFLLVWEAANNSEKAALTPLMLKKKTSYFKKAFTEFSAAERQSDPTYLKLRKLFPEAPPF